MRDKVPATIVARGRSAVTRDLVGVELLRALRAKIDEEVSEYDAAAHDVAKAFELPPGAPQRYVLKSPWKDESGRTTIEIEAGKPHFFQLEPFQVLVWEALLPRA